MGDLYNWVLFAHIIGATVWFGGAVAYESLSAVAKRTGDPAEYTRYMYSAGQASGRVMPVAALITLVFGVWLVLDGVYEFSDVFVSIGFAAVIIGLGMGLFVMMPKGKRFMELVDANGFDDPQAYTIASQIGMADHLQTLVVAIAMFAMVFKF
ncbi:MAG: DUF2269 family protein [Acidimicrobiia bacterium]|nr:DUF2269 family protein [Acidimicrobiia bacterium]